jgi:hypothetical protein
MLSAVSATALPKVDAFKPMTLRVMNFASADDGSRWRGLVLSVFHLPVLT